MLSFLLHKNSFIYMAFVAVFVVLAAALLQLLMADLLPCPVCILQRYFYLLLAVSCVVAYLCASHKNRVVVLLPLLLALFFALSLFASNVYLWNVANHPSSGCGIDPWEDTINSLVLAQKLPLLFMSNGVCGAPTPPILGVGIVQWSLLVSGLMLLWLVVHVMNVLTRTKVHKSATVLKQATKS